MAKITVIAMDGGVEAEKKIGTLELAALSTEKREEILTALPPAEEAIERWLLWMAAGGSKTGKPLAESTETMYRHMVRSFYAVPGDPRHSAAAIGARWCVNEKEILKDWRTKNAGKTVHVNKMTRYLRQFWNFCGDEDDGLNIPYFSKNPSKGLKIQASREPARHTNIREDDQVRAIRWFRERFAKHPSYNTLRDLVSIGLLYHSGLRPVEVYEHVTRASLHEDGDTLTITDAKTEEAKTVIVPPHGTPEREEWDMYLERHKAQFEDDVTLLFPSDLDGNMLSRSSVQKNVVSRKMRSDLGLPKTWGLYAFRHNKATQLARRGASEFEIMHVMGHRNASTTRKYIHLNSADLININRKYLGGGTDAPAPQKAKTAKNAFKF